MKKSKIIYTIYLWIGLIGLILSSCKKFIEIEAPETQPSAENVYSNDATAIAVLTGLYSRITQGSPTPNFSSGTRSFSLLCGLSADEYTLFSGASAEMTGYYQNALMATASTNIGTEYWGVIYDHIYFANAAIEGLENSKNLTESIKKQLIGEAKFIRAFFYFYLVNLYGDVPIVITTDYKINQSLPRSPKEDVYLQIINDLKASEELLGNDYLDGKLQKYTGTVERVRPTKWAAKALLARTYLYKNDFTNAELKASELIDNTTLFDTSSLNDVFLKNSRETIWQLQPTKSNQNTDDSKMFIITTGFNTNVPVRLRDTLLNSFEVGDNRKSNGNWVKTVTLSGNTYYYPYKYKNNTSTVTEYLMVLRLSEQYLVRAEARSHLGKITEAKADLNVIRKRAGLANTLASDQNSLLNAILHERQVEFFSEWGHRWFDLIRTNNIHAVMNIITPQKSNGAPWQTFQKVAPIRLDELLRNQSLTQTQGY